MQHLDELPYLFAASGLSEDAAARWEVGHIDDRIGAEHDGIRVPHYSERFSLGVGLYRLDGVFERELGETAPGGLELVAGRGEKFHPPGRFGGE